MRFYIAGKIANTLGYQAKFLRARDELLALGHDYTNPCEIHDNCSHTKWEEWMVCDIHVLLDCDGVYALRDWTDSPGATVEVNLAIALKKVVIYQGARPSATTT